MLIRIGNRFIETEAIASMVYRPGTKAMYDDNEQLRQEGRVQGITIMMLSGSNMPIEFEGEEAQPLLDWANSKAQISFGKPATNRAGSRPKVDSAGTLAPNVNTPSEPSTVITTGGVFPVGHDPDDSNQEPDSEV